MGKKPIVSVTYENERISVKNSLPYLKCVLRLSCVVHGPIYGRFMGFYVNGFLSIKVYHRRPKRTICGFGLQRSFGRNILELLVYYLMPNKCKKS